MDLQDQQEGSLLGHAVVPSPGSGWLPDERELHAAEPGESREADSSESRPVQSLT